MQPFSEQEIQGLTEKLTHIWTSTGTSAPPLCTFEAIQFRFRCEVTPEVIVSLVGYGSRAAAFFVQWPVIEARLRWRQCELVCDGGKFKQSVPPVSELQEAGGAESFFDEWLPHFRRGCFLSGIKFQHSPEEEREWIRWYHERIGAGHNLDFESRRIAAAFDIHLFESELKMEQGIYKGNTDLFGLKWQLKTPLGQCVSLEIRSDESRTHIVRTEKGWRGRLDSQFHEQIARGFYLLGWETDKLPDRLTHELTAHERLELRHALPHEFWPKIWPENTPED